MGLFPNEILCPVPMPQALLLNSPVVAAHNTLRCSSLSVVVLADRGTAVQAFTPA